MSSPTTSSALDSAPAASAVRSADEPSAPPAIVARNVGKKYELQRHRTILLKDAAKLVVGPSEKDVFWALRDVTFDIRRGETVGFVGPNGAGKSTLLSLMAKTADPTVGSIEVTGRVSALLELGAGFHPDFTGRENIFINGSVMGLTRKQIEERLEDIVSFSELGRFIDEPVRNYSSGMLARLGFSVATSVDPDILIVDEALSVGDAAFQEKSLNRILEFQQRGCTIVFVSHSIETVAKICQRAILLANGQVLLDGPAPQVAKEYTDRLHAHTVAGPRSPYEKELVPAWKRLVAAAALGSILAVIGYVGAKYVLSADLPEQRPLPKAAALNKAQP